MTTPEIEPSPPQVDCPPSWRADSVLLAGPLSRRPGNACWRPHVLRAGAAGTGRAAASMPPPPSPPFTSSRHFTSNRKPPSMAAAGVWAGRPCPAPFRSAPPQASVPGQARRRGSPAVGCADRTHTHTHNDASKTSSYRTAPNQTSPESRLLRPATPTRYIVHTYLGPQGPAAAAT